MSLLFGTGQLQWTSEQLHSPVVVNLLGPEIEAERSGHDSESMDDDSGYAQSSGADSRGDSDDESSGATPAGESRLVWRLGSGLPTAGSLLAHLWSGPGSDPPMRHIPPGRGYRIEVTTWA